jgi:transposase
MARQQKQPLRPLAVGERTALERIARAGSERADRVARAKALLAVAGGAAFTEAARAAGMRCGDTVGRWVARFNNDGLAGLDRRHGGGPAVEYGTQEQERILQEFRRQPERERDGTATWSLTTLRRALRKAPDGLPQVSTWTLLQVLHDAGYTWQNSRTWCPTGSARRKRQGEDGQTEVVEVQDPRASQKRDGSSEPTASGKAWVCPSGVRTRAGLIRRSLPPALPGS